MAKGAERLRCRPRIYCAKLEIAQAGVCSILELFHVAYGEGEAGEGAGGFAVGEELIDVGQVLVVAGLVEGVSGAVGRGEAHDGIAFAVVRAADGAVVDGEGPCVAELVGADVLGVAGRGDCLAAVGRVIFGVFDAVHAGGQPQGHDGGEACGGDGSDGVCRVGHAGFLCRVRWWSGCLFVCRQCWSGCSSMRAM